MGIFCQGILPIILVAMQRNAVGPRVRKARKLGTPPVSQVDLAARLQLMGFKIDQSGVSKIEQGRRPVLDLEVIALAQALKVPAAWLLGETDAPAKLATR